jgi:PadR family transcriptional regulator AphA
MVPAAEAPAQSLPAQSPPALSLSEWIVLSLVCEGPTHGNAVGRALARSGDLGRIWQVPRGVVYRSLERLTDLGLIRPAGEERSTRSSPSRRP